MSYKLVSTQLTVKPGYDTIDVKIISSSDPDYRVNFTIESAEQFVDELESKILEAKQERVKIIQGIIDQTNKEIEDKKQYLDRQNKRLEDLNAILNDRGLEVRI